MGLGEKMKKRGEGKEKIRQKEDKPPPQKKTLLVGAKLIFLGEGGGKQYDSLA